MRDKYATFAALEAGETLGTDYDTTVLERIESGVLIMAPHGGSIEVGTSELATLIAGDDYSLFSFDGLKPYGRNRDLHITSHNFDHPGCIELAARHNVVLTIHGCKGAAPNIYIGGLDAELSLLLAERLGAADLPIMTEGHAYPGRNPLNICNRGARGRGTQLEFTPDLRGPETRAMLASLTRGALAEYMGERGYSKPTA